MAEAEPGSTTRRKRGQGESQQLWRLAGIGGTLASEIIAGVLIGLGLDHYLGTAPTLLIVGTVAGVLVGMASFLRTALKASKASLQAAPKLPRRDLSRQEAQQGEDEEDRSPPAAL